MELTSDFSFDFTAPGTNPPQRPVSQAAPKRLMPDFAGGTHAHTHSVHSALVSLAALGVPGQRIVLRRLGRQASSPGTIVGQRPAPGTALDGSTLIELDVTGLGFSQALPVGMWDSGGEAMAGTREILEPFDDPLEKLKHWFHEGAPLFRIAPNDPEACARWLTLFGVDPEDWPRRLWYKLAALIAHMSDLGCTQQGTAFVLQVLLDLPVASFSYQPSRTALPAATLSRLGARSSRLGVDLLMGDEVEDLATLKVELGPVPLETYDRYTSDEESARLLKRTMGMIMPLSTTYEVAWSVLDKSQPPRLGMAESNSRLGINTHMGLLLLPAAHSSEASNAARNGGDR